MNLHTSVQTPQAQACPAALAGRPPLSIKDVVLRHLRSEAEISGVLHLREEIDLSVHAAAGPQFAVLEKKETSAALSSVSISGERQSARSASFRWAIN